MKTRSLIILAAFVAIAILSIFGCTRFEKTEGPQFAKQDPVNNKKTESPQFSKQDSAYILTRDSNWVKTTDSGNLQDMHCERRLGYGPAVKIRVFRSGNLREVYRKYYTKWNTATGDPTDSIMNLELRSRQVQPGEYWVIAAAAVYLNDQLIRLENDGHQYYGDPTPEEIKDPVWTPQSYRKTFTSLAKLNNYAKKNNSWLVICSKQTSDLLGWMYTPKKCYLLKIAGKKLPVLEIENWGKEKAEWEPIHIKYRYLCIGWGGRDIEYGPGVSAFNMKNTKDPGSLDHNDFVVVDNKGRGYYYGEEVKDFSLKDFEGI